MNCRIDVVDSDAVRTVRVAGRLTASQASDLLAACLPAPATLCVDLTDLSSIDPVGTEVLRRVRDEGARLTGVPRYIQFTLDVRAARARRH